MLTEKTAPIGICDHCLGPIHPDEHYTSKGKLRRYCRNTANSRNGNEIRTTQSVASRHGASLQTQTPTRATMRDQCQENCNLKNYFRLKKTT